MICLLAYLLKSELETSQNRPQRSLLSCAAASGNEICGQGMDRGRQDAVALPRLDALT